jgi:hypothetical protein
MGKVRGVAVGCVLAIGVLASVASSSEEAAKVDDRATSDAGGAEAAPAGEAFAVGDTIELGELRLVVHGVTDPLASSNPVVAPAPGSRWVAVDTEVSNLGGAPVAVSSLMQFEVQDATNAAYDITITGENLPSIDGEVPAGGSRRGTMAFEVPEAATGLRLVFAGDLLSSGSAVIALG